MCYPTLPQLRPQCSVALLRASTTCHWTTPSLHLIPPLTHQMWGYPAHHPLPTIATETLEQFNSPPNCSGYHPNVRSALSHSSSPFTCERHALEKGGNSHRSGMCQSFVFNLLKHFGLQRLLLYSSCNFAGLGKKGKIQGKECVRVLAFQCQNFPFQEYLFPTAYHL